MDLFFILDIDTCHKNVYKQKVYIRKTFWFLGSFFWKYIYKHNIKIKTKSAFLTCKQDKQKYFIF